MKIDRLVVQECVHIGEREDMKDGVLYLSRRFGIAIHMCACGCRVQTVTPIEKPHGWDFFEGPHGPTLRPSIGNQRLPCKSHYWVTDGAIVWCADSPTQA